ncbi:MAG: PKD domain-containing protein, partial [Nitrospirae bacterium]
GWTGDCAEICGGSATCTIIMDSDKTCSAQFGNSPPVIDSFAAEPTSGDAPLDVTFNCQAHDVEGEIANYHFSFGDGTEADTDTGTINHTYNDPGIYQATCRVYDSAGSSTESEPIIITVTEAAPSPVWQDITEGISVARSRTLFDRINRTFWVHLDITNLTGEDLAGPVRMILESSSIPLNPAGPGIDPDGYTEDGKPYFIIVPEGEVWASGETIEDIRLDFMLQRKRLMYELSFEVFR